MTPRSFAREAWHLIAGLVLQDPTGRESEATLDPVRLLLLTFAVAALFTGRFTAIVIALIVAFIVGRFLAFWRDGTFRGPNAP